MGLPRASDAFAQHLQEDRLAKLCDDNAFVNVSEVLRRQRRDGGTAGAVDVEAEFLEPSEALVMAPPRIHISRILLEQHRAYLKTLEEEEEEEGRRRERSEDNDAVSSEGVLSASAASSEDGVLDSPLERDKRPRAGEGKNSTQRRLRGMNDGKKKNTKSGGCAGDRGEATGLIHVGRECRNIRAWCQSRRVASPETTVLVPSYTAMAAPPPAHPGGYHLCSVCLLPAAYKCVRCHRALFCSIDCHVVHNATRCMKFIV